jgi:hypothetical protein
MSCGVDVQDSVNQLKDLANASPAIKLFAEWCEKCTEYPLWRGRFKVRAHVLVVFLPCSGYLSGIPGITWTDNYTYCVRTITLCALPRLLSTLL